MRQDLASLLRAHFMCKVIQGQSAALFQVEASLFSLLWGFFPYFIILRQCLFPAFFIFVQAFVIVSENCVYFAHFSLAWNFVRSTSCPQQQRMKYVEIVLRS